MNNPIYLCVAATLSLPLAPPTLMAPDQPNSIFCKMPKNVELFVTMDPPAHITFGLALVKTRTAGSFIWKEALAVGPQKHVWHAGTNTGVVCHPKTTLRAPT
jgi:hypothetical protein